MSYLAIKAPHSYQWKAACVHQVSCKDCPKAEGSTELAQGQEGTLLCPACSPDCSLHTSMLSLQHQHQRLLIIHIRVLRTGQQSEPCPQPRRALHLEILQEISSLAKLFSHVHWPLGLWFTREQEGKDTCTWQAQNIVFSSERETVVLLSNWRNENLKNIPAIILLLSAD